MIHRKIGKGGILGAMLLVAVPVLFAGTDGSVLEATPSKDIYSETVRESAVIHDAVLHNPEIKAARAEWEAVKKQIPQSWALPDPMIGMDVMGSMVETRVGPEKQRFMVQQVIPFPLKLYERYKISKAEAEAAQARTRAKIHDVIRDVRNTYSELYETDAALQVIHEIQDVLKKIEEIAQTKYSNESAGQRDVAKAQAEVSMSLEQIYMLEQRRASLTGLLNELLDRSPLLEFGALEKPEKPEVKSNLLELFQRASTNRGDLQADSAEVKKSKHSQTLAKLEYLPDLDASFVYTQVGNGTTTEDMDGRDSWMFPLRVNVPLWQNRIIPMIQQANREVEAAEARLQGTKNKTFYEVKDAFTRYQTASKIVLLYETAVIPQAKLALTSDQAGYEAGRSGFLDLLDSQRVYLNAQMSYLKIYTELLKSVSDLEQVCGSDREGEKL